MKMDQAQYAARGASDFGAAAPEQGGAPWKSSNDA
jgi:hypothetical protein